MRSPGQDRDCVLSLRSEVCSIIDIGKGGAARARILTETQKKEIVAAPDPDDRLPASIGEQILDVISHVTYADSSMNTSWSS
jgi:hypothetical protein